MLYYEVYEQKAPTKIPGSARQVRLPSGACRTEWDWEANLENVASGIAPTAEEAWKRAKVRWPHPVLRFPEVRYRAPLGGEL